MTHRQLIWLGAALVLLLVIAFVAGVFDEDISTVDVPELSIPAEQVTEISISGPDLDVLARREEGAWRIAEPVAGPADSSAVMRFLESASAPELQSVVSRNPERYGRYGVDSTGYEVTLRWDDESRTMIVGERGPTVGTRFVRIGGVEAVYLASRDVIIPPDADSWRDRIIVDIPPEDVSEVRVEGPAASYRLRRQSGRWMIALDGDPIAADSSEVDRYLRRFSSLRSDGFVADTPPISATIYVVLLTLEDGRARSLQLIPDDGNYAVTVDDVPTVFRLNERRLQQIVPEAEQFTSAESS